MFKRELVPIFLVVFVSLLGFSIILPLLPFYAQTFDASAGTIGWLVASYSICQFIASPILGGLSDKYGRRPVLIYSQLLALIGFVMLAGAQSIFVLFLSRIIDGFGGGGVTIAQAYIADTTKPEERAGAMAVIGIAFGLGFMVGPLMGGQLAVSFGYPAPALVAAGLSLLSIILTSTYLTEPRVHRETEKKNLNYYRQMVAAFKMPQLGRFLLIFLFFALPFALFVSMFSLFANKQYGFTPDEVGYFLAFVGFMGIIWQGGVVRPMVKRYGELISLKASLISMTIGLFGIAIAENWWHLALVSVVFSFGSGIVRPTLSSLITQVAPQDKKGSILGIGASIDSFSRSVAPIFGGWIIGGLHPNYLGWVGGALALVGVVVAYTVKYDSHQLEEAMIVD